VVSRLRDDFAELGLHGAAPSTDPMRARHLVALGIGVVVTLVVAAFLLLVALPGAADQYANVFLFLTRLATGK
jgi:hypothetical protein